MVGQEDPTGTNNLYVECQCHDLNHITKIVYDRDEREFWLEFTTLKYAGHSSFTFKRQWLMDLQYKWFRFKEYLKNVKTALRGRPIWFTANGTWNEEHAKMVSKFIEQCIQLPKSDDRK